MKILERRIIKAIFTKNGKGYKTSKIAIPSKFFEKVGITENETDVQVSLYENKIELRRSKQC